jgi:hypothetical protein
MLDIANLEPLALASLFGLVGRRRSAWAWWCAAVVVGQIVVAAATSTDATPGAGAPSLVPVLAVEHALVAFGLARAFPRRLAEAATAALGLALAGFGLHASYGHRVLSASEGGRPRFEPDVAREAGVESGLLFFEDDTGYELARDPAVPASHGVEAVRLRGDDHDRLAYDLLGHPPTHRYLMPAIRSSVVGWSPPGEGSDTWRFEAESSWPPVSVEGGAAEAIEQRGSCASGGRALLVTPTTPAQPTPPPPATSSTSSTSTTPLAPVEATVATVVVELPVPRSSTPPEKRSWVVTPRVLERGTAGRGSLAVVASLAGGEALARWEWADAARGPTCMDLAPATIELGGDRVRAWLVIKAQGGPVAVDRTLLRAR